MYMERLQGEKLSLRLSIQGVGLQNLQFQL